LIAFRVHHDPLFPFDTSTKDTEAAGSFTPVKTESRSC
jgi:hypothetical protein